MFQSQLLKFSWKGAGSGDAPEFNLSFEEDWFCTPFHHILIVMQNQKNKSESERLDELQFKATNTLNSVTDSPEIIQNMQSALLYAVIELYNRSDECCILEEYYDAFLWLQILLEDCMKYQRLRDEIMPHEG